MMRDRERETHTFQCPVPALLSQTNRSKETKKKKKGTFEFRWSVPGLDNLVCTTSHAIEWHGVDGWVGVVFRSVVFATTT